MSAASKTPLVMPRVQLLNPRNPRSIQYILIYLFFGITKILSSSTVLVKY